MAKPTATTELGGAKVLLLADSVSTTPGANTPAAVIRGTSGESTYPVGWLGVATHQRGDPHNGPGGFTGIGTPVVMGAGYDNSAAGTVRAMRMDENGVLFTRPNYALDLPLQQANGGVTLSAAAEAGITTPVAGQLGYLLRLQAICVGTVLGGAVNGGSWNLRNGTAGTVVALLPQPFGSPALGHVFTWEFPVPLKNSALAQAFTITPSSTFLGTWAFLANGYRSVL